MEEKAGEVVVEGQGTISSQPALASSARRRRQQSPLERRPAATPSISSAPSPDRLQADSGHDGSGIACQKDGRRHLARCRCVLVSFDLRPAAPPARPAANPTAAASR